MDDDSGDSEEDEGEEDWFRQPELGVGSVPIAALWKAKIDGPMGGGPCHFNLTV